MEKYKLNILPAFRTQIKNCKFSRVCKLYSNSSYTCTHVGGEYCGKYRALNQPKDKIASKTEDAILVM